MEESEVMELKSKARHSSRVLRRPVCSVHKIQSFCVAWTQYSIVIKMSDSNIGLSQMTFPEPLPQREQVCVPH